MKTNKHAFTLAEVLITLAIIGVVATMTIPTLMADYNQKSWNTASSVFNRRLGEALAMMNSTSSLAGYNSTADFVEELSKHIKIVKTCDKNNLTDCFIAEIATGADPVKTSDLKTAKNLYFDGDYDTETMGVMFGDGTSALIAYNKNVIQDPLSNQVVRITGNRDNVAVSTDAISILYDVNGLKSPNEYGTGKDIKGLNVELNIVPTVCSNGLCIANMGLNYKPVDCSDTTGKDYKYCATSSANATDYWAGAKKKCADIGMSLPSAGRTSYGDCPADAAANTLCGIYNNRTTFGVPASNWYWTASEYSANVAWGIAFGRGAVSTYYKYDQYNIICVDN